MKFSKILEKITPFASVAASFIPGGPAVLAAVNAFLPDEKKLPETATGGQILSAVEQLPPDQRAALMSREIDLKIAQEEGWTERYVAMANSDGQSTRPQIALMMAWMLVFETVVFMMLLGVGVYKGGLAAINQEYLWTVFGVLTTVPASVLAKYFGELRKEQQNRLGIEPSGVARKIMGVLGR